MNVDRNELGLQDIISICGKHKKLIILITLFFTSISTSITFFLPTYYVSEMLVKPRSIDTGNDGKISGLGSLNALAGGMINTVNNDTALFIEHLNSRVFILSFINSNNIEADVFAAVGYDAGLQQLKYDNSIYDKGTDKWLSEEDTPSPLDLYSKFVENYFSITVDENSNLVTLSIRYFDPQKAYDWLQIISSQVNEYMQNRAKAITEKRLEYLEGRLQSTINNTMHNLTGELIQEQMRVLMMNNFNDGYAFEVIDPPMFASEPEKSPLLLLMSLGFILGFTVSILIILWRHND